jgi:hypothetical protein
MNKPVSAHAAAYRTALDSVWAYVSLWVGRGRKEPWLLSWRSNRVEEQKQRMEVLLSCGS